MTKPKRPPIDPKGTDCSVGECHEVVQGGAESLPQRARPHKTGVVDGPDSAALFTEARGTSYSEFTMWNVKDRFSPKSLEGLNALGFAVGSTRGVVRVEKYGSGAEFRKGADEMYQMTVLPTIMLKGQFTRLWDAGYQKFLLTDEGLKIPALATHLENLRKFNEELRTALGVPTFYNEALGSVSQVSVYDRVKGRAGDVPDETVGAHSPGTGH
jgi:hypothetical protein